LLVDDDNSFSFGNSTIDGVSCSGYTTEPKGLLDM